MPASITAIMKNVERLGGDAELVKLWNGAATDDRTPGQAWTAFIAAADAVHVADRIPGSVGRSFRAKYAEAGPAESGPKAPRVATAASGAAPASTGSKAGGSAQRRSKAAQAPQKEAAK